MSDLAIKPELSGSDTDDDLIAHICRREDIARAYVTGEAIEALCGKKWVPSRDPENYPVCEACTAELERLRAGWGGSN